MEAREPRCLHRDVQRITKGQADGHFNDGRLAGGAAPGVEAWGQ